MALVRGRRADASGPLEKNHVLSDADCVADDLLLRIRWRFWSCGQGGMSHMIIAVYEERQAKLWQLLGAEHHRLCDLHGGRAVPNFGTPISLLVAGPCLRAGLVGACLLCAQGLRSWAIGSLLQGSKAQL